MARRRISPPAFDSFWPKVRVVGIWKQAAWFYIYLNLTFDPKIILAIIVQSMKHLCQKYKRDTLVVIYTP